jgi:hypothetical protein
MPELQSFSGLSPKHLYATGVFFVCLCMLLPPHIVVVLVCTGVGGFTTIWAGLTLGLATFLGMLAIVPMIPGVKIQTPRKSNMGFYNHRLLLTCVDLTPRDPTGLSDRILNTSMLLTAIYATTPAFPRKNWVFGIPATVYLYLFAQSSWRYLALMLILNGCAYLAAFSLRCLAKWGSDFWATRRGGGG